MTDPRPELVREAVARYWARHRREYVAKRLRDFVTAVRRVLVGEWRRRFG